MSGTYFLSNIEFAVRIVNLSNWCIRNQNWGDILFKKENLQAYLGVYNNQSEVGWGMMDVIFFAITKNDSSLDNNLIMEKKKIKMGPRSFQKYKVIYWKKFTVIIFAWFCGLDLGCCTWYHGIRCYQFKVPIKSNNYLTKKTTTKTCISQEEKKNLRVLIKAVLWKQGGQ